MATGALLLASAVWGWTFVLVKDALREVGPLGFLALRFALASLLAAPLLLRQPEARSRSSWRWGAILGLALFGGYFFQTWGLVHTTVQKSGLITGLSVVLVPLLAWVFGRRPARRAWLGVALGGSGVALLSLGGGDLAGGSLLGDLLTVVCAISFALHLVLVDRYAKAGDPRTLLVSQVGLVAVISLAGAAVGGEQVALTLSAQVWVAVAVTGALATTGAFALVLWAGRRISASRMAVVLATEPMFASLFGWWLLGEALLPVQGVGAALVMAGILTQLFPSARR